MPNLKFWMAIRIFRRAPDRKYGRMEGDVHNVPRRSFLVKFGLFLLSLVIAHDNLERDKRVFVSLFSFSFVCLFQFRSLPRHESAAKAPAEKYGRRNEPKPSPGYHCIRLSLHSFS